MYELVLKPINSSSGHIVFYFEHLKVLICDSTRYKVTAQDCLKTIKSEMN
jgi:hypothetical protein